jgi:hypothetical protein
MTESGIDEGIEHYVDILRAGGIETCQSCEGGPGHAYPEPTVDFRGDQSEGPRAVAVALAHGLPLLELRRTWEIRNGEMVGPLWALTFRMKAPLHLKKVAERSAEVFAAMGKDQS